VDDDDAVVYGQRRACVAWCRRAGLRGTYLESRGDQLLEERIRP
jgi:hypothetical protein